MGTSNRELEDLVKRERKAYREKMALANTNHLLGVIPAGNVVGKRFGGSKELPQAYTLENDLELYWLDYRLHDHEAYVFHSTQFLYFIPPLIAQRYLNLDKLDQLLNRNAESA